MSFLMASSSLAVATSSLSSLFYFTFKLAGVPLPSMTHLIAKCIYTINSVSVCLSV